MKQIISLILILIVLVSCATPNQTFLAFKHKKETNEIQMISESNSQKDFSPFLELYKLMEFTDKSLTTENFDSVKMVYQKLENYMAYEFKPNCQSYNVQYCIENDTLCQTIYYINGRTYQIRHDKDIIQKLNFRIKRNFLYFINKINGSIVHVANDSIYI